MIAPSDNYSLEGDTDGSLPEVPSGACGLIYTCTRGTGRSNVNPVGRHCRQCGFGH